MKCRALTVPLLLCFILGSYVAIEEQIQTGTSPSPSASAGWYSSSASESVSITESPIPYDGWANLSRNGQMCTSIPNVYTKKVSVYGAPTSNPSQSRLPGKRKNR